MCYDAALDNAPHDVLLDRRGPSGLGTRTQQSGNILNPAFELGPDVGAGVGTSVHAGVSVGVGTGVKAGACDGIRVVHVWLWTQRRPRAESRRCRSRSREV